MASILELVFDGKVTTENVRSWLDKNKSCRDLDESPLVQAEFIQYFLNFLRDQSAPILQGCRSANATPSKTPTVLKSQRSITFADSGASVKTSTPRNAFDTKRVQLFAASPLEGDSLTCSSNHGRGHQSQNDSSLNCPSFSSSRNVSGHRISPGHASWSHNSSQNTTASPSGSLQESPLTGSRGSTPLQGSGGRRQNRITPGSDSHGKRNRNNSIGSYTPDMQRSQQKHNLGEFLVVSNPRKKKSPKTTRRDELSQQLKSGAWKSGGKGKHLHVNDKSGPLTTEGNAAEFILNNNEDFPGLAVSKPLPTTIEEPNIANKSEDLESMVITPSRKLGSPKKSMKSPIHVRPVTTPRRIMPTAMTTPRRITPTAIVTESSNSAVPPVFMSMTTSKTEEEKVPNSAFATVPEGRIVSLAEERKLLREAKANHVIPISTNIEETTPQKTSRLRELLVKQFTPTKLMMDKMSSVVDAMPEISQVTHRDKLDVMVDLYAICLRDYMVPNVTVELYFLVQLLTTRGLDAELAISYLNQDEDDEICYLASVHNAVYFAVSVFEKQQRLLALLDKGILRLFVDNQRMTDFSRTLKTDLIAIIENCQLKVRPLPPSSPVLGVSFQADTDNRKNFPHDRAFHTFKKQRDNFYELLREWQENHMQPGWSMRDTMASRIRELVGTHIDLTNHVHFARLFQSQLIMMCKGDRSHKVEGDDAHISLLNDLKLTNPAKFKRLQERFISPQSVGSPCPQPSFPGCQEFFRDFVIISSSYMFNHHLTHTMVEKITDLNGTQFSLPETESEQDGQVDPEDLETLSMCLLTMRLLGKFLGFLTFLPYQSSEKLPDTMEASIINQRNQMRLPINIVSAVRQSMVRGRTVLTTPWVVEFLSMMDPVAPRLRQIQEALTLLVHLYRSVARDLCHGNRTLTLLLAVTSLGWLFELPIFPEGLFFKSFPFGIIDTSMVLVPSDCVDKMDLVDHNLFFMCCPYVAEVKSLLMGFAVGSNNKGSSIRKITPMTTETESAGSVSEKQLQAHLEENFFHNHPASMKRTVEFVADRVSSNYIKKFRAGHLPRLMQQGHKLTKEIFNSLGGGFDTRSKRKARQQVEDLSLDLVTKAHRFSSSETSGYAFSQVSGILPLLLPEDTAPQVIKVASEISARVAQDKVAAWMSTHMTKAMFVREYSPELEKLLKALILETSGNENTPGWEMATPVTPRTGINVAGVRPETEPLPISSNHDASGQFPSEVLVAFKEVLRDLVKGDSSVKSEDVEYQIGRIVWCLENRQDIISGVFKSMGRMTVDIAYVLVLRYPSLCTEAVQERLFEVWTNHLHNYVDFTHVICIKHVHWISSKHDQGAWKNLSDFIIKLLDRRLTTFAKVEEGANSVLRTILSPWLTVEIETFMSERLSQYHAVEEAVKAVQPVKEDAGKEQQSTGYTKPQKPDAAKVDSVSNNNNEKERTTDSKVNESVGTDLEVSMGADKSITTDSSLTEVSDIFSPTLSDSMSSQASKKKSGRRSLSKEWGSGTQDCDLKPLDNHSSTSSDSSCDKKSTSRTSQTKSLSDSLRLDESTQNVFCDSDLDRGDLIMEPKNGLQRLSAEKACDVGKTSPKVC